MQSTIESIGRMQPYGFAHIAALVFTVAAAVLLVLAARRVRGTPLEHRALAKLMHPASQARRALLAES